MSDTRLDHDPALVLFLMSELSGDWLAGFSRLMTFMSWGDLFGLQFFFAFPISCSIFFWEWWLLDREWKGCVIFCAFETHRWLLYTRGGKDLYA
jgi:hypothetical protein